jgi:hypothetical protein
MLETTGQDAIAAGVRWQGALAWAVGLFAYLWIAGRLEPFGMAGAPAIGASLPSLALAAAVYLALARPAASAR